MSLLNVSGIYRKQGTSFGLNNISFTQHRYRQFVVAGETGSGKSTLLKIVSGLMNPDAGEVWFNGERVKKVPEEKLIPGHKGIGYLSQHFELPHHLTVAQVLSYASHLEEKEAEDLYDLLHISHLLARRTDQLSGGERQRIALGRLLVTSPRLLVLDEPFSNMDLPHKNLLKSVIRELTEKLSITCLLASHDPQDTISWADEILVIRNGTLIQQGSPRQVYQQPIDEYAAGLFGSYNRISAASAPAFFEQPGIVKNGKDLLLRPEDIRVVSGGPLSIAARVQDVFYFGSHYEAALLAEGLTITIRMQDCTIAAGENIRITFSAHKAWYL